MTTPVYPTASAGTTSERKRHLYLAGRGFIYAGPGFETRATSGFAANILLPVKRGAFEVAFEGKRHRYTAVALRQLVERDVYAPDVDMLNIGVSPNHWYYRNFRAIPRPGGFALDREAYADLDEIIQALCDGQLDVPQAIRFFKTVVERTVRCTPRPKRISRSIERALQMLSENPNYPLNDLATAVGLSYDRMSYLFTEAVGLPLRSYLLWQKIHISVALLTSGRPLTEIALAAGFSDSAHLSNSWQKAYGVSPSYFAGNRNVQIHVLPDNTDYTKARPQAALVEAKYPRPRR